MSSAFLQVARHLEVFSGGNGSSTEALWEALAVAQHHDGVSGTAKQGVTFDYAKRMAVGGASSDAVVQAALGQLLTKSGGTAPMFSYCPDANVSLCAATAASPNLVVALYNPQARTRTELVRIPIPSASATVSDGSGTAIASQVVALPANAAYTNGSLPNEVRFIATVNGLSIATFFIQSQQAAEPTPAQVEAEAVSVLSRLLQAKTQHRHRLFSSAPAVAAAAAPPGSGISNQYWKIDFDSNGLMSKLTNQMTGTAVDFAQNFFWYHSYQKDGDQNSGGQQQQRRRRPL